MLARLKTPETQTLQKDFADRLAKWMKDKGYSQSKLAREIWGSMKDSRGYDVARNRDRISAYLAGAGLPETENLQKLCDALGCSPDDLVGPVGTTRPLTRRTNPIDVQLATVSGQPDMLMIVANTILPAGTAIEILKLIQDARSQMVIEEEGDEREEG